MADDGGHCAGRTDRGCRRRRPRSREHRTDADVDGQSVGSGVSRGRCDTVSRTRKNVRAARVRGAKSGRVFELPVQYAREGDIVVVFPGGAARKNWWRNLRHPAELRVWIDGAGRRRPGKRSQRRTKDLQKRAGLRQALAAHPHGPARGAGPHPTGCRRLIRCMTVAANRAKVLDAVQVIRFL